MNDRKKIAQLEADLEEMKKDKDVEMSRWAAKIAQIEANLKIAKLEADLVHERVRNRELERKIAETKRKNDDLEAPLEEMKKEMSQLTAKMAQIKADLMGENAKLEADLVAGRERNRELERKIAEAIKKNEDLEAQLRAQNTEVGDGKAKIGELEEKITELQSKNFDLEAQIQFERENKTAEIVKLRADLNRTMSFSDMYRDGWSYFAENASWYKVIDQNMTFDEAVADCAGRKGHLVSIHSQEENDFVQELAKNFGSNSLFWIGLKRNPKKENAFEWTDRSPVQFTNWAVAVPLFGANVRTDPYSHAYSNPNKENAFEWTDGSSVDFTNWGVGHPNLNTHAQLLSHKGTWYSNFPTYQSRFICQRSSQF